MRGTPGSAKKVGGCCGTFRLWVVLLILHVNSDVCRALENDDKNDKLHRSPQLMSAQVPVGGEKEVTLHSQPVAPGFKQRPPVVTEAMLVDFLRSAEDLLENRGGWKVLSKADDCKVHTRPRAGTIFACWLNVWSRHVSLTLVYACLTYIYMYIYIYVYICACVRSLI